MSWFYAKEKNPNRTIGKNGRALCHSTGHQPPPLFLQGPSRPRTDGIPAQPGCPQAPRKRPRRSTNCGLSTVTSTRSDPRKADEPWPPLQRRHIDSSSLEADGGPDVQIQQGQGAPPANIPPGSILLGARCEPSVYIGKLEPYHHSSLRPHAEHAIPSASTPLYDATSPILKVV